MAQRRMFATAVMETDAFLDLPDKAKTLYFYLCMNGDDDGFVGAPRKVMRVAKSNERALQLLADRGWILGFDSGVVVITDWHLHNTLQNDRYKETLFQKEKAMIQRDEKGRYVWISEIPAEEPISGNNVDTECIQPVSEPEPQQNITEQNKTEPNKTEHSESGGKGAPAGADRKPYGEFGWIRLTDREYGRLCQELGEAELKRCIAYVDESAQATGNKNQWRDWAVVLKKCHRNGWGRGKDGKLPSPPGERPKVPGAVYL